MGNWLEQLKAFKFLEHDITSLVLLLLTVGFVFAGQIAGASLLFALFFTVSLFRTLPRMKSWKVLGTEVEWYEAVKETALAITNGTAELHTDFQSIDKKFKISPPDLQQWSSIASSANEKLKVVESANTALDTLLSQGFRTWAEDGGTITISKGNEPGKTGLMRRK
jgi:hypothetical protein